MYNVFEMKKNSLLGLIMMFLGVAIIVGAFSTPPRVAPPSPTPAPLLASSAQTLVQPQAEPTALVLPSVESATTTQPASGVVVEPISDALSRVTKKPFGIYVRPGASPVSPERFQGYHAGVDFETTAVEQSVDVTVSAICAGPLMLKKWATGYGGVAVQSCRLDNQDVTIIYGHLRLASISAAVGQELKPGQSIGVLGKGYSTETDGERKHLHLGIHKGAAINILGYVQKQSDLGAWLDVRNYLSQ
jgi:murein DD-endopeptidase MepM/ murein hydrolase activator NlpD